METVPKGLSEDLESYFTRLALKIDDLEANKVPEHRTSLPTRPVIGRLYFFSNVVTPTIVPAGLWIYKSTGWLHII